MIKTKKIAVLTSGGDAPGMNKCLYTLYEYATLNQLELVVIKNGFFGLYNNDFYQANEELLTHCQDKAGSIIYSSRFQEFINDDESIKVAKENLEKNNIDILIILGGNGSYLGAKKLSNYGIKVIALPFTIDNDIEYSEYAIGFDSALNAATRTIDQLKSSINTHNHIIFTEVMGNKCSDLTLGCSLATNANYTIISENKKSKEELLEIIKTLLKKDSSLLIVVSEYIYTQEELIEICNWIQQNTKVKTKNHIIGFVQRGATPTSLDRMIATSLAINTINQILANNYNIVIGLKNNELFAQDINNVKIINKEKTNKSYKILKLINKGIE